MKTIRRFFIFMMLICMMISVPVSASSLKISKSYVTMKKGSKKRLTVNTKKKVKWSSTNKKVATVSSKGVVKAKKAGTAYIKAKVGKKVLKCKVKVKKAKKKLTPSKLEEYIGKSFRKLRKDYPSIRWDEESAGITEYHHMYSIKTKKYGRFFVDCSPDWIIEHVQ